MSRMQNVWTVALALGVTAGIVGVAALPSEAIALGKCNGTTIPCPLQQWMRDNAGTPMAMGDLTAIAKAMDKARTLGGSGMLDWNKLAKKTADDAGAFKTDDVKADCKGCHDAYKEAYKSNTTLRNKPIP